MFLPALLTACLTFFGMTALCIERCAANRAVAGHARPRHALEEMPGLIGMLCRVASVAQNFDVRRIISQVRVSCERLNVMTVQKFGRTALFAPTFLKNPLRYHLAALAPRLFSSADKCRVVCATLVGVLAVFGAEPRHRLFTNPRSVWGDIKHAAARFACEVYPHSLAVRPSRPRAGKRTSNVRSPFGMGKICDEFLVAMRALQLYAPLRDQFHIPLLQSQRQQINSGSLPRRRREKTA